jgi:hypothetical protein
LSRMPVIVVEMAETDKGTQTDASLRYRLHKLCQVAPSYKPEDYQ